jgi:hypothetical protein
MNNQDEDEEQLDEDAGLNEAAEQNGVVKQDEDDKQDGNMELVEDEKSDEGVENDEYVEQNGASEKGDVALKVLCDLGSGVREQDQLAEELSEE